MSVQGGGGGGGGEGGRRPNRPQKRLPSTHEVVYNVSSHYFKNIHIA